MGMKTLKVDNGYYDKVKALSDASGESLIAASNGVVAAGLGELKGLGDALRHQEELTFNTKEPERKIGNPVKAELEVLEEEEEEEEEQGTGTSWLWVGAALIGILALRHRIQQTSNAQQNGLIRNG